MFLLAEFDEEQYRREVAEEGFEEGRQQERRNTIFRMFDKGMTDEVICNFLGETVSMEELSDIRMEWKRNNKESQSIKRDLIK